MNILKTVLVMLKKIHGLAWKMWWKTYRDIAGKMLEKFKVLGCNMSLKVNFLHATLDYLPEILDVSEEQEERFHQDIKERWYQGRWNIKLIRWPTTVGCCIGSLIKCSQTENQQFQFSSEKEEVIRNWWRVYLYLYWVAISSIFVK